MSGFALSCCNILGLLKFKISVCDVCIFQLMDYQTYLYSLEGPIHTFHHLSEIGIHFLCVHIFPVGYVKCQKRHLILLCWFLGPITVGYERTVYTTTEGDGSVTLCAIVTEPATGGAPRPFTIAATTSDGTAGEDCVNHVLFLCKKPFSLQLLALIMMPL